MQIIARIEDKYNSDKIWVVKKSKCSHFYVNQEICGKMFYKKYSRTTKKYLRDIGIFLSLI